MRHPPLEDFSTMEKLVMAMVARRTTRHQIALRLSISRFTVDYYLKKIAKKIPGDLPVATKIHFWTRGATLDQLTGEGWLPGGVKR